jgi:membrane protein
VRRTFKVLVNAAKGWSDDNVFKHSAAVSFYTLFSLAPITIIAVSIAGFFLGRDAATQQFAAQMAEMVGKDSAKVIQTTVAASEAAHGNWVSTIVGLVVLLIGATSVFGQLQDSLNQIWGVRAEPARSGWMVMLFQRLISFGMVLTVGFLLLVSLMVSTVLQAMLHSANGKLTVPPAVAQGVDLVVAVVVITLLFAAFFKFLPDVVIPLRAVWGSAFLTSILFSGGRFLIALYLGHSNVASVYGAAGSLVALLVWIYYSCAIMFYGVEYLRASREADGMPVKPKKTAVLVRQELVAAQ